MFGYSRSGGGLPTSTEASGGVQGDVERVVEYHGQSWASTEGSGEVAVHELGRYERGREVSPLRASAGQRGREPPGSMSEGSPPLSTCAPRPVQGARSACECSQTTAAHRLRGSWPRRRARHR